jgi:tetratricopeptide (TPR) repeat protein
MVLKRRPYERNIYIDAALLAALFCLLACASGCGTTRETALDRQYQRIVEQQQAKRSADADDLEAKISDLEKTPAYERMGDAYFKIGNTAIACMEYGKALQLKPDDLTLRHKMGRCMLRQKMWAPALEQFDFILVRSPGNPDALQGRATACMRLERFEAAEAALRSVIKDNSASWQAYALLGMVYDAQKRYIYAAEAYEKAIVINPRSAELYNRLGTSLYSASRYRESAEALLRAIKLNPSDAAIYDHLGFALFKAGLESEAFDAFKKSGDEALACNNMGKLYLEKREYARSIDYFSKAIDLRPSYYEAAHNGLKKAQAMAKDK